MELIQKQIMRICFIFTVFTGKLVKSLSKLRTVNFNQMRSKLGDTVKCNTFFMTELIKCFSYVKISVSETSFRFRSWIVNFLDSFPLWLQWQASVSSFILFFLARYFYLWHKFGVQKLRLMIKDRYAITWWHTILLSISNHFNKRLASVLGGNEVLWI